MNLFCPAELAPFSTGHLGKIKRVRQRPKPKPQLAQICPDRPKHPGNHQLCDKSGRPDGGARLCRNLARPKVATFSAAFGPLLFCR